jgi:hypothetical protein
MGATRLGDRRLLGRQFGMMRHESDALPFASSAPGERPTVGLPRRGEPQARPARFRIERHRSNAGACSDDSKQASAMGPNSSRWGIELGSFIAAIQGSDTQPLALRID